MPHPFPHSMSLLRAMAETPPPLIPPPTLTAARETYARFLRQPPSHARELEDALIAYGRIYWPYRKAFDAFVHRALSDEHRALIRQLEQAVPRAKRNAQCEQLVAARSAAAARVRAAVAEDATAYEKLVREFQEIQHDIEQHLSALRQLAARTAQYPEIRAEIDETLRHFERGLAHLAQEPEIHAVCAAVEAYAERHEHTRARVERESGPHMFR